MKATIRANYRNSMVSTLTELLESQDEEVLRVKSNEIAIPFVTDDGEEGYYVVTVKIPTGSRDGSEYDGYLEAEDFAMKEKAKAQYLLAHFSNAVEKCICSLDVAY